MIKANKGDLILEGMASELTAELCLIIRHLFEVIAQDRKLDAIAAYKTAATAMARAAENLVKEHGISIDDLNGNDDEKEDDDLSEFVGTLSQDELKALLGIINKFDIYENKNKEDD